MARVNRSRGLFLLAEMELVRCGVLLRSPSGESFLGPFTNHTVSLELGDLPTHNYIGVFFDLLVVGNANQRITDLRIWNWGIQNEPPNPIADYFISVQQLDTLGFDSDTVYPFGWNISHNADYLTLVFSGPGFQTDDDGWWGLDNFRIETRGTGPETMN